MSSDKIQLIREAAEADLLVFIRLVAPHLVLGSIHEEVIRWWCRSDSKKNQLLLLPRGHLKAQSLSSKVLTPTGWTTIGELSVGDLVIGGDGLPKKVTYLHPISEMDLYEVTTRDKRKTLCNKEHLWNVIIPSNTGDKVVTKSIEQLLPIYKIDRFDKRNKTSYIENRVFIPSCDPIVFDEKSFPIDPYTLGVWLGDGHSQGSNITTADPEIFEYIPYPSWKNKQKYLYRVGELHSLLRKNNLLRNKHIPNDYLFGSIKQRLALLQGLMDTDGTCHKDGNIAYFSNTNENLIDGCVTLVRSLGGVANKLNNKSSCNGKWFDSWVVSVKLPAPFCPFRLSRKVDMWDGSFDIKSAIVNIELKEKTLGRCISVEDELYITDDYLMTHNSKLVAYRVAWWITKHPETTILYVSATADLAEKQLYAIKQILDNPIYRRYWPEMIGPDEGRREKWAVAEIAVDHPKRKIEGIRDSTCKAVGLTANMTGFHADVVVLDDIVVPTNAYTEEGRDKVAAAYSQLASIENPGAQEWVVGTRYHPKDIYQTMLEMKAEVYNSETGDLEDEDDIYEVFQRVVETGGEFLWPVQIRADGKSFGFDSRVLANIKGKYQGDITQFYAQYYNNPNSADTSRISSDKFQYYERSLLMNKEGDWYLRDRKLNVYAAIDFAFSLRKKADYSAIVVVGVDHTGNFYILDVDRFKTSKIVDYFNHIVKSQQKWGFRKIRAEITVAQQAIVNELKESYIKPNGIPLSVDEYRPNRHQGDKEERVNIILEPKYDNLQMWHYRGGNCQSLEEELTLLHPPHDDIKDALANAIDIAIIPKQRFAANTTSNVITHSRFGGVAYA